MSQPDFLIHEDADNVGVIVVEGVTSGQTVVGLNMESQATVELTALADIPLGHKIALVDMAIGDQVTKYAGNIGRIIGDVSKGGHVHVHNCKTNRW
jgi:(2R)-sulfolactate sulfo-lyase subunit alpha